MASDQVDALDEASLDQFRIELIKAASSPSRRACNAAGAVRSPLLLTPLTSSPEMQFAFQDGSPHQPPKLFIPGKDLVSEHVAADGEICLWRPDDASYLDHA